MNENMKKCISQLLELSTYSSKDLDPPESLCDLMDDTWYLLSIEEQELLRFLSAELWKYKTFKI